MAEKKEQADPCTIVIFGASGDLTSRKLLPALHSLSCEGLLHPQTNVIGLAWTDLTEGAFRDFSTRASWSTRGSSPGARRSARAGLASQSGFPTSAANSKTSDTYAALARLLEQPREGYRDAGQCPFLPCHTAATLPGHRRPARPGRPQQGRPGGGGSLSRSPSAPTSKAPGGSTTSSSPFSPRVRSSGSITTSARKRSRTF